MAKREPTLRINDATATRGDQDGKGKRNRREGGTAKAKGDTKTEPQPIHSPFRENSIVLTWGRPPGRGCKYPDSCLFWRWARDKFAGGDGSYLKTIRGHFGLCKSLAPLIGLPQNCTCGRKEAPRQYYRPP